jgi:hypothetical protein
MSLKKSLYYKLLNTLPKNNLGDKLFSIINFIRAHRRLPNSKKLLSNYLFKIKHSVEGHNPSRAFVSDKAFVKDYVRAKVGEEFNVPTIAIINNYEECEKFEFPDRCCLKPTHLSGSVILRKNGENINFELIRKWFGMNHYKIGREKNYRYLRPKLIVEPLIFDRTNNEDYKFFCFKGKAKFVQIDIDRYGNHTRLFFDRDWNLQDFSILKPRSKKHFTRPVNFKAMLQSAETLSRDFEFIRVDLYTDENDILVGELTNWPENGLGYFVPRSGEYLASSLLFSEE